MSFWDSIPPKLRNIFNDGLDEVLIFAVVFIFILLSGHEGKNPEASEDYAGILPLLIIAAFLFLFSGFCRSEEQQGSTISQT